MVGEGVVGWAAAVGVVGVGLVAVVVGGGWRFVEAEELTGHQ